MHRGDQKVNERVGDLPLPRPQQRRKQRHAQRPWMLAQMRRGLDHPDGVEIALPRTGMRDRHDPLITVDLTNPRHPQLPLLDQHCADLLKQRKPFPDAHDRLVYLRQRFVDASNPLRATLGERSDTHPATAHNHTTTTTSSTSAAANDP